MQEFCTIVMNKPHRFNPGDYVLRTLQTANPQKFGVLQPPVVSKYRLCAAPAAKDYAPRARQSLKPHLCDAAIRLANLCSPLHSSCRPSAALLEFHKNANAHWRHKRKNAAFPLIALHPPALTIVRIQKISWIFSPITEFSSSIANT